MPAADSLLASHAHRGRALLSIKKKLFDIDTELSQNDHSETVLLPPAL